MARWTGSAWSAPELIPNLPAGAFTPSLAFDRNNHPILAFVVPSVDPQTGRLGSGDGNSSALYAACRRASTWEVAPVGSNIYAEDPLIKRN
ncbi:MAG: hypothetical protein HY314_03125 [Acidobacteria bacterium]|nr:hypothetical protein [Acidobacteriota bacterium]